MKDTDSLAHTTWNCKYHIVFAPKYRRKVIYGKIRVDIGKIMRMLCARKGIEIIEAECCPDHIHMLVKIPPKYSIAEIVGYLKGKSALMIFDRHANLKYRYGNRHFWCRGYYVDTVGKNEKKIAEYVREQLQDDIANDQISLKEYIDPFSGKKFFLYNWVIADSLGQTYLCKFSRRKGRGSFRNCCCFLKKSSKRAKGQNAEGLLPLCHSYI